MQGTFNLGLVAISFAISVFGSYTALQLAGQVTNLRQRNDRLWLAGAALALGGGGIWSMHFIGMLAYKVSIPVTYDMMLTLASMLVAVLVTGIGLNMVICQKTMRIPVLIGSGIIMGLGVASMHYTGMAAMRIAATVHHDHAIVAISIAIAIFSSIAALWIAFTLRKGWQKIASAFVMGAAVCGMHYTAMSGYSYTPTNESVEYFAAAISSHDLAGYVAIATVGILTIALLAATTRQLDTVK